MLGGLEPSHGGCLPVQARKKRKTKYNTDKSWHNPLLEDPPQ